VEDRGAGTDPDLPASGRQTPERPHPRRGHLPAPRRPRFRPRHHQRRRSEDRGRPLQPLWAKQSEWVLPGNAAPETKGWIGERYDADTGLQDLNARYYDPELSLFLQPDWFEVTKAGVGTNRFSYSANDTVNRVDPTGNSFWSDLKDAWSGLKDAFSGNVTRIDNAGQKGTNGSYGTVHINGTTYGCFGCSGTGNSAEKSNLNAAV
jgi:RHS repeat-associated protein